MITRRKLLMLLPAAAMAWEYVAAGTPEISPNYSRPEHWWGMLVDIDKCIGCGNCVRACAAENSVPDGYFRTWVERYHVAGWQQETPQVDSPNGGKNGFPPSKAVGGKNFFVPKMCNHCEDSPCTQVCPVGATFRSIDGVVLVDEKYCLPTGARQLADLKNPKDPIHEYLKTHSVQVLKPHLATGAKVYYHDLDGSVR